MANYIGVRCPVCNKKFGQQDDIVVCPVCGAPHHRECYAQKNECAFAADHLSGNVWRAPAEAHSADTTEGEVERTCSICGNHVPKEALFCQNCGGNLNATGHPGHGHMPFGWGIPGMGFANDPSFAVYGGVKPDEKLDGELAKDLALYIGQASHYYLPRFKIMAERKKSISPNFSALIFNFIYYFYRKMYLIGFVLLVSYVVSAIPGFLYSWETLPIMVHQRELVQLFESVGWHVPPIEQVDMLLAEHYLNVSNITQAINFGISVIASIYANRIYFGKAVKDVHKIRTDMETAQEENRSDRQAYESALIQQGGVTRLAPAIAVGTIIITYFIVSGATISSILGGA